MNYMLMRSDLELRSQISTIGMDLHVEFCYAFDIKLSHKFYVQISRYNL